MVVEIHPPTRFGTLATMRWVGAALDEIESVGAESDTLVGGASRDGA